MDNCKIISAMAVWLTGVVSLLPYSVEGDGLLTASQIAIPSELGFLSESHEVSAPDAPLLILIQDVHANPEAQRNIAGLLEYLVDAHAIRLVLVEGSSGKRSMTQFHQLASQQQRESLGEAYLKSGYLTAPEYFSLVKDVPLEIWGVEDPQLYQDNVRSLIESNEQTNELKQLIDGMQKQSERLAERLLNDDLLRFLRLNTSRVEGADGLTARIKVIVDALGEDSAQLRAFENVSRYHRLQKLQKSVELDRVRQEYRAAMEALRNRGAAVWEELDKSARALKAGDLAAEDFYLQMDEALLSQALRGDYPVLSDYCEMIRLKEQLDLGELLKELEGAERTVAGRLAVSDAERKLLELRQRLSLMRQMVSKKLSAVDYARYRRLNEQTTLQQIKEDLDTLAFASNLDPLDDQGWLDLNRALDKAEQFYVLAAERDSAIAGRVIQKLERSGERIAVLIVGGFHTGYLAEQLAKRDIRIAVVTPNVDETPAGGSDYVDLMKLKSDFEWQGSQL